MTPNTARDHRGARGTPIAGPVQYAVRATKTFTTQPVLDDTSSKGSTKSPAGKADETEWNEEVPNDAVRETADDRTNDRSRTPEVLFKLTFTETETKPPKVTENFML